MAGSSDEMARVYQKLREGTLHELHCNANHDTRVGTTDTGCCCNLGREILALRLRAEQAEARLREINEQLALCPMWALGAWDNLKRIAELSGAKT